MNKTLILLTNNKFEDPFLHSQLINVYHKSNFNKVYLYCGLPNMVKDLPDNFVLEDNFITTKKGILRYVFYYYSVFRLIRKLKRQDLVFHLRGFVSSLMFYFISIFFAKKNYIYDPRGAFIYGKQEVFPKYFKLLELLRIFERKLIKNSLFTIVESNRLKKQMTALYGFKDKYEVCYNVSSFNSTQNNKVNFVDKDTIKICYCGSVNHWHDIKEIRRILEYLSSLFTDKKVQNYIFTQKRNHAITKDNFNNFKYPIVIDFVPYNELEAELIKMDLCVSVVLPNKSTEITSPIKISDYILLNKIIVMNKGIGDFDDFFKKNKSAILFGFREPLNFSAKDISSTQTDRNEELKKLLSVKANRNIILNRIKNGDKLKE